MDDFLYNIYNLNLDFDTVKDDRNYIEQIKQKEIHENISKNILLRNIGDKLIRLGALPDFISCIRCDYIVNTLRYKYNKHNFIQVPVPGFDAELMKKHSAYYSSPEQRSVLYSALLNKKIDVAVMSLAELDEQLPSGLQVAAITERKDPEYALVTMSGTILNGKDQVGVPTQALAQQLRSESSEFWCIEQDYVYHEAIEALRNGKWTGIILPLCDFYMSQDIANPDYTYSLLVPQRVVIPAGQGSMVLVVRKGDKNLKNILQKYFHNHLMAYIYKWERRASKLLEFSNEKAGVYIDNTDNYYKLYLYNPLFMKPLLRLVGGVIGDRDNGIDLSLFNNLFSQVYGELCIMGLGPGSMRFLTHEVEEKLRQCDIIYCLGQHMASFSTIVSPQCKLIDIEQDERYQSSAYLLKQLRSQLSLGLSVAICVQGDPYFLNVGINISKALRTADIPFKLMPGLNSLMNLSMQLGLPFICPGYASACHIFDCRNPNYLQRNFSNLDGTLIFYAKANQVSGLLHKLESDNFDPDVNCAYISNIAMGVEPVMINGRLGSFFRKLHELERTWDGYFVVGKIIELSKFLDMRQVIKAPLSEKNILVPISKDLNESDKNYLQKLEKQGANIVQFKIGSPLVSKKCAETVRIFIEELLNGKLRLNLPKRVSMSKSNKQSLHTSLSAFNKANIWLVFHTTASVQIFFKILHEDGYDMRSLASYNFACLNKNVFRALAKEGILSDLNPEVEDPEHLARSLVSVSSPDDIIVYFSHDGHSNIFDSIINVAKRHLLKITIYEQQLRLPGKKQLLKLIDECDYILFTETQATVTMIQAMVAAGFDHDTILARPIKLIADNKQVKDLLLASGFKLTSAEQEFKIKGKK